MLNWSITFLVVGLIAAVLGFTGLAGAEPILPGYSSWCFSRSSSSVLSPAAKESVLRNSGATKNLRTTS